MEITGFFHGQRILGIRQNRFCKFCQESLESCGEITNSLIEDLQIFEFWQNLFGEILLTAARRSILHERVKEFFMEFLENRKKKKYTTKDYEIC